MSETPLSRRDLARCLAAAAVALPEGLELANEAIRFRLKLAGGRVTQREFEHRRAAERVALPVEDWELEFDGGKTVSPESMTVTAGRRTLSTLALEYRGGGVAVRVEYELPVGRHYLRRRMSVRTEGAPRRLFRADLDRWKPVEREWRSMKMDSLPYGSHPIFCDTLFAGVEFPAAFNQYSDEGFVLRSRPGGKAIGREWVALRSTVVGVCAPGEARYAFLDYLEDVRLAPARLVACYNSWWTLPKVVVRQDNVDLIRRLKVDLFDRHGVFFDIITTDMGWSSPRTVWEIDGNQLPQGFDDIRGIVEAAGGKLGLWMSPSEMYPPVCDYDWLEQHGYTVLRRANSARTPHAMSLADTRFREETKAQLVRLIRENNLGHIKYDGFIAEERTGHHGMLPGVDSVEPLAEASLELLEVSKKANPALVTEPTYMNSIVNYISPWILKYSDSVWGNSGGDCPLGMGAAPDYRESQTNAREYYIFSSLDEFWLPQNAVHYFDIVHCDQAGGFANHAAMAFGRGRFFLSTYVNPKFLTPEEWGIYAGFLKWGRANQQVLRNTVVLPSRVENGEPYAYAHWEARRAVIAVRNPSNETREYRLELGRTRPPAGFRDGVAYTLYPHTRGLAAGLDGRSVVPIVLAPWELLFVEIRPAGDLPAPVVVGGRWLDGQLVHDGVSERLERIGPGGAREPVALGLRRVTAPTAKILRRAASLLPEAECLREKGVAVPTVAFRIECEVEVPGAAASAEVLLLVQVRGRKFFPSQCRATVNGTAVELVATDSAGHTGYYESHPQWAASRETDRQWSFYRCPVPRGKSLIQFDGGAGGAAPEAGVWAWAEYAVAGGPRSAGQKLFESPLPGWRAGSERVGARISAPITLL